MIFANVMRTQISQWVRIIHGGHNFAEANTSPVGPTGGSPALYTRKRTYAWVILLNQPTWAHTYHSRVCTPQLRRRIAQLSTLPCSRSGTSARKSCGFKTIIRIYMICIYCSHYNHVRDIRNISCFSPYSQNCYAAQAFRETARNIPLCLLVPFMPQRYHR